MKSPWSCLVLWTIVLLSCTSATAESSRSKSSSLESTIKDRYIVSMRPGVTEQQFNAHREWVKTLGPKARIDSQSEFQFGDFRGYAGHFDKKAVQKIKTHKHVESVMHDAILSSTRSVERRGLISSVRDRVRKKVKVPWGLAMINTPPGAELGTTFEDDPRAGQDIRVYVLDSGIDHTIPSLKGRVEKGKCFVGDCGTARKPWRDDRGHGTMVADIIAGKHNGVAKKATLVDVKINTGGRSTIGLILEGLFFVSQQAVFKKDMASKTIINLSQGLDCDETRETFYECENHGIYTWLDRAFNSLEKQGILTVVAAGNDGLPAEWAMPNGLPSVFTVGSLGRDRKEAASSNYGPAVDILAPGHLVQASGPGGKEKVVSGTSFAAPHVSGFAAYLQSLESFEKPSQLKARILRLGAKDAKVLEEGLEGRGQGIQRPKPTTHLRLYDGRRESLAGSSNQDSDEGSGPTTCKCPKSDSPRSESPESESSESKSSESRRRRRPAARNSRASSITSSDEE